MSASGDRTHFRIAIIGSGFGGLGAAIRLKQEGVTDFVVLERAEDVGGTWRDNSYPGCACDVQSHVYSFSFALNPDWSRSFSPQPEIWAYLQRCARDFGVLPHLRFGHTMTSASWDDSAQRWRIETTRGSFTASMLILATGPLSDPMIPKIRGAESFAGRTFHSAQWAHDYDLTGRRVVVIGTGASAIQFVPEIQPRVGKLTIFQRTAPWILPRPGGKIGPRRRAFFRRVPFAQSAIREIIYAARELMVVLFRRPQVMRPMQWFAERYLERAVRDPVLRAKLTPDFTMGCKRILLSNSYLPALAKPNVDVVTTGIAEIRPHSVVDVEGVEHPADAIIYGTGFRPTDQPITQHIHGRDGRSLGDTWAGSPKAYLGTTVAGFPNFFVLLGPNTGLGHNSVVCMIEAQIEHVLKVVQYMQQHGIGVMEPKPEAQAAFIAGVDRRMQGTVWVTGGCRSWYLDSTGRNSTLWPDSIGRFRRRTAQLNLADYVTVRAAPAHATPPLAATAASA